MIVDRTCLDGAVDVADGEEAGETEEQKFRKRRNELTAGDENVHTRRPAIYTQTAHDSGRVHIDTTASPSTRIVRVPRNTSLHVFQRRPFTLIRVLYVLYGLPVNFTRTSSFCAGRVSIQPV